MEQDITNWKNLWGEKKSSPVDLKALISKLSKIERKNKKERIFLLIMFPLTLLILTTVLPILESYYYLFSIGCIAVAMFIVLLQLYRSKLKNTREEAIFNNQEFIKATIVSLKDKMVTTSKYIWMYTMLLLLAINVGYIEALGELSIIVRILIHVTLTTIILSFMYLGIKKRMVSDKKEILPIINELEGIIE